MEWVSVPYSPLHWSYNKGAIGPKVLVLWYLDTQSTQISRKLNVYLEFRKLKGKKVRVIIGKLK